MLGWLPRLVARIPATVHAKLLVAFLVIVGLLLVVGGVALRALSEVNKRAEHLIQLQRARSPPIASSSTTGRRSSTAWRPRSSCPTIGPWT